MLGEKGKKDGEKARGKEKGRRRMEQSSKNPQQGSGKSKH